LNYKLNKNVLLLYIYIMMLQLLALRIREILSTLQRIQRSLTECVRGDTINPVDIVLESSSSDSVNELV